MRCRLLPGAAFAAGGLLVALAVITSSAAAERAVLGEASGALSWGPALLRLIWAGQGSALLLVGWHAARRGFPLQTKPTPSVVPGEEEVGLRTWLVLSALSVIAVWLRVWRLDSYLWYDEVVALVDWVRPPLGKILTSSLMNQHMLFSLLAHLSISIFGESAWALRVPSVLFGLAGLWAVFLLGRRLIGTREALLACALMTVSYHHVWFSQDARAYAGLLFFATLATWLWLEALRRQTWPWFIAYAIACALGVWLHVTMAFIPAAHVLLYLGRSLSAPEREGAGRIPATAVPWKLLAAWTLAGSLILEFYALALPEFLRSEKAIHLGSEWTTPTFLVTEGWHGLGLGFGQTAGVFGGLAFALVGWLSMMRRDKVAGASLVLPALIGPPTIVLLGQGFFPRYFFFSFGFALLVVVHGVMTVARVLGARLLREGSGTSPADAAGFVVIGGMITISAFSLPRLYALPKQDFVGARDYVERVRQEDDATVAVGLAGGAFQRYFAPQWLVAQTRQELEAIEGSHQHVWLVYTLPIGLRGSHPDLWELIQRDFQVIQVFPGTLGDGAVNVCRERTQQRTAPPSRLSDAGPLAAVGTVLQ
ncbi:MAG: glycosyltransferase family 39 protein [Candidatus Binatia bacterium]